MPKKLKTFVTGSGFFEYAVALPTRKAAIDVLHVSQHDFQYGFVKETSDPAIVEATLAKPGVVLSRGVGTKDKFSEHATLPSLENLGITPKQQSRPEEDKPPDITNTKKQRARKPNPNP